MIKTINLPPETAVVVKAIGTTKLEKGDSVLVGVKCVWTGQRFEPITPGFATTKNVFDYCGENELIILKREK